MEETNNQVIANDLEKCNQERGEYLNNWKRERADFVNYKKDEGKRMEEFLKFSTEGIILELIDVIDGVEVARNNLPESKELLNWVEGFDSSLNKLGGFLKKFGVEKIDVKGQKFDPNLHEAVVSESGESVPEGVYFEGNLEEVRPGYKMHGKVIRPARVKIIK